MEVHGNPLEETPQLEAEALAVGVVATLKEKEKIKIAAPSLLKDLVARRKRNHAHGLWQENAKIRTVRTIILRFASFSTLLKGATGRIVPTLMSPKRSLVLEKGSPALGELRKTPKAEEGVLE